MAQPQSGLPVPPISNHPNCAIGDDKYPIVECVIVKDEDIVRGRDTSCPPFGEDESGIYVSKLKCGGAASKANIHVGDRVLAVDDKIMTDVTHEEAVKSLTTHTHSLNVKVRHEPAPYGLQQRKSIESTIVTMKKQLDQMINQMKSIESTIVTMKKQLDQMINDINAVEFTHGLKEENITSGSKKMSKEWYTQHNSQHIASTTVEHINSTTTQEKPLTHSKNEYRQEQNSLEKQNETSKHVNRKTDAEMKIHPTGRPRKDNHVDLFYLLKKKTAEFNTNQSPEVDVVVDYKNDLAASAVTLYTNTTPFVIYKAGNYNTGDRSPFCTKGFQDIKTPKGSQAIAKPHRGTGDTPTMSDRGAHATDKPIQATSTGDRAHSDSKELQVTKKPQQLTGGTLSCTVEPRNTVNSSPVTDDTPLSSTVEPQNTDKPFSSTVEPQNTDEPSQVTDGTPLSSTVEPQNTDTPSPVTDGTPLSSTVEPQNTDNPSPVTDGTPLSSTVEPQSTDKPSPVTDGTPFSSTAELHTTDKPSPVTDGTPLSSIVEPWNTDKPSPVTDGTPLSSTVEPQNTDKPSPVTDGTPLSSTVEPQNTDKPSPVTDDTPLSSTVEPQNTDKPSLFTDGTPLSSTGELHNTDKPSPVTDGTPLPSTVETHNTDKPPLVTDGTPLSSTVEPQNTDKPSPVTDDTPLSSTVEPHNTVKLPPVTDGTPLSSTVEPQNTDKPSPVTDDTPLSSTVEPHNTVKLPPVTDGTPLSSTVEPHNTDKPHLVTDGTPHSSTVQPRNTVEPSPVTDGTPLSSTVQPQNTVEPSPVTDGTPLSSTVQPQNTVEPSPVTDGTPLSSTVQPQNTVEPSPVTDGTPLSSTVERRNTDKPPAVTDGTPLSRTVEPHITEQSPIPNKSLLATDTKAKSTTVTEETQVADTHIVAPNKAKRVSATGTRAGHVFKVHSSEEAASRLLKKVYDGWSIWVVDNDNWTKLFKSFNSDDVDKIIVLLIYRQDTQHKFKEPKEEAYKRMKEEGHVLLFEAGVNKDATDCRMLLTIKELFVRGLPKNVLVKVLSGDKIFLEMMVDMKAHVDTGQLDLVHAHDSVLANYDQITKLEPRDDVLKLAFINIPTSSDKNKPVVWGKNMVIVRDDSLLKYTTGLLNDEMKLPHISPVSAYRIPQKSQKCQCITKIPPEKCKKCKGITNTPPGIVIVGFASDEDSTRVLINRPSLQGSKEHMNVLVRPIQSWNKRLTTRHLPTENI